MMYVVRVVQGSDDIVGVFDSYEKAKEYSVKLYEEFYNKYADKEYWETPEKVLSCFDWERGIEDFIYFEDFALNEGKGIEFFF